MYRSLPMLCLDMSARLSRSEVHDTASAKFGMRRIRPDIRSLVPASDALLMVGCSHADEGLRLRRYVWHGVSGSRLRRVQPRLRGNEHEMQLITELLDHIV